eukprot:TRINITY_DN35334_c1_g2_i2.p1 TRINITY_DN35334_c1_g2~~TRINITY_DN35334_c1_g2_i2.p1  ORF type:complete len:587 (+),score=129.62 TRINITY_DN35334_c1_g2_i2:73-1761(+)
MDAGGLCSASEASTLTTPALPYSEALRRKRRRRRGGAAAAAGGASGAAPPAPAPPAPAAAHCRRRKRAPVEGEDTDADGGDEAAPAPAGAPAGGGRGGERERAPGAAKRRRKRAPVEDAEDGPTPPPETGAGAAAGGGPPEEAAAADSDEVPTQRTGAARAQTAPGGAEQGETPAAAPSQPDRGTPSPVAPPMKKHRLKRRAPSRSSTPSAAAPKRARTAPAAAPAPGARTGCNPGASPAVAGGCSPPARGSQASGGARAAVDDIFDTESECDGAPAAAGAAGAAGPLGVAAVLEALYDSDSDPVPQPAAPDDGVSMGNINKDLWVCPYCYARAVPSNVVDTDSDDSEYRRKSVGARYQGWRAQAKERLEDGGWLASERPGAGVLADLPDAEKVRNPVTALWKMRDRERALPSLLFGTRARLMRHLTARHRGGREVPGTLKRKIDPYNDYVNERVKRAPDYDRTSLEHLARRNDTLWQYWKRNNERNKRRYCEIVEVVTVHYRLHREVGTNMFVGDGGASSGAEGSSSDEDTADLAGSSSGARTAGSSSGAEAESASERSEG